MIEVTQRDNGSGGVLVMIDVDGETLGSIDIDRVPKGVRVNAFNDQTNEDLGTTVILRK